MAKDFCDPTECAFKCCINDRCGERNQCEPTSMFEEIKTRLFGNTTALYVIVLALIVVVVVAVIAGIAVM